MVAMSPYSKRLFSGLRLYHFNPLTFNDFNLERNAQ